MKILSVDFDIIMSPCISLYNMYAAGDENATVVWNRIEHELDIDKHLSYDANILSNITLLILNVVKNGAYFFPIQEHQEIVKYLPDDAKDIELVNVDFHHDIIYNENDRADLINFNNYSCANWIGFLYYNKMVKSIDWFKAPNSSLPIISEGLDIKEKDAPIRIKNVSELYDIINDKFDAVFFCFSPQWVPYKYKHLYDLIVKICFEILNAKEGED